MDVDSSPIQEFYSGKSVFVTGFTGVVGKVFVEKLIRCCDIKNVYVLLRPKYGLSTMDRLKKIVNKQPFNFHDKTVINLSKIVPIEGDISSPDLGISNRDMELLKEVSIFIHCAANVKFDADLDSLFESNVIGTKRCVELCNELPNLKAFIYVSTAYSFCDRKVIDEKVYQLGYDLDDVAKVLSIRDPKVKKQAISKLMDGRPNCYTLTKALAEQLVMKNRGSITTAIVRPSIVVTSYRDPVPGWVDSLQGMTGIGLAAQVGLLQTVDWNYWSIVDVVPVDFCANALIATGWYVVNERPHDLTVITLASGCFQKTNWGAIFQTAKDYAEVKPSSKQMRPLMAPPKYKRAPFYYPVQKFIYHTLFALLLDMIVFLTGNKPFLFKLAQKLNKALDLVKFFTTNEFIFKCNNLKTVVNKLSPKDKEMFDFDFENLNLLDAIERAADGTRYYILKENDSMLPRSRIQAMVVCCVYRLLQVLFVWLIWKYLISWIIGIYPLSA